VIESRMTNDEKFDHLYKRIKHAHIEAVRRDLDAGVSAALANADGWTLLMLAAREGNLPIGELLISRGADLNAQTRGVTALSEALSGGHIPFMKLLLDHGAAPDLQSHETIAAWLPKYVGSQKTDAVLAFLKDYFRFA